MHPVKSLNFPVLSQENDIPPSSSVYPSSEQLILSEISLGAGVTLDAKDTSSILYPAKVVGSAAAATVQLSVQRFSHVPLPDSVPSGAEGTSTHVATALSMVVQDAVTAVTAVTPVEAATPVTSGSSWQLSVSARVTRYEHRGNPQNAAVVCEHPGGMEMIAGRTIEEARELSDEIDDEEGYQ